MSVIAGEVLAVLKPRSGIPFNPASTRKTLTRTMEKAAEVPRRYHLIFEKSSQQYRLILLGEIHLNVSPKDTTYGYVILKQADDNLELILGIGPHHFIAGGADSVIAAGDIVFLNGKIEGITDQSGGYHTHDPELKAAAKAARESFRFLPMEKFKHFEEPAALLFQYKSGKPTQLQTASAALQLETPSAAPCA